MTENEEKKSVPEVISWRVHEADMARLERTIKRLWFSNLVAIIIIAGMAVGFFHYESQFEDVVTVTQETPSGNNSYIGRDGDITYGTADYNENPAQENGRQ